MHGQQNIKVIYPSLQLLFLAAKSINFDKGNCKIKLLIIIVNLLITN